MRGTSCEMHQLLSHRVASSLALAIAGLAAVAESVVVTTGNGTVQGGNICGNANTNAFLSIPYAKAPIGNLRFAAPQPYDGSYNLTSAAAAPSCIQFGGDFIENGAQSEDW